MGMRRGLDEIHLIWKGCGEKEDEGKYGLRMIIGSPACKHEGELGAWKIEENERRVPKVRWEEF